MKPLNESEPGCNFTTSNCVIWQGPDIPCLNLCKGDTVSDVIFKLATEVCGILHTLDIDTYDLSCFNLTTCKPKDFEQLFQFLMDRVCKLEQCTGCIPNCNGTSTLPTPVPTTGTGGENFMVPISECFYFTNSLGDQVTALPLKDYVTLIGNTLCQYFATIGYLQNTVNNLSFRVGVLETAPPAIYVPPTITPSCVLPPTPTEMNLLLEALEQQFCQLRGATGLPNDIYTAISVQPTSLNTEVRLNGAGGTMASIPGWKSTVTSESDSLTNMWLTILDIRQAVRTIQATCCPSGCDGITLSFTAILDGTNLTIYPVGTIPPGFLECAGSSVVKVTDASGNSAQFTFSLLGTINNPTGYLISLLSTTINPALDLTLNIDACLNNSSTNAQCENCLEYFISNSSYCPSMVYSQTTTAITYIFTSAVGAYTYAIELWDNLGTTLLSTQTIISPSSASQTGTFIGLGVNTNYKLRVTVVATDCPACIPVECAFQTIATNPQPCIPPTDVEAEINII